ncbi:response regulator [Chthonobacter albigriseus]|uniref:response regulator n=1 Tax=Chthonobacter albigriseus TaxID=1683161 RepID=UPI0015EEC60E|nr:response regulator [Chthonobacter albigriseus]
MSLSETIAPHLPYLRRYARALNGTQTSGDAYVIAVLEALVASPESFDRSLPARVALYMVFSQIWNSVAVNAEDPHEQPGTGMRAVEALTPQPRQAFLLTTVEGFSVAEAATILGTSEGDVMALIEEAGREIAGQVATDVLIIEDEPIIAMDLEMLVESLGHTVVGNARTHKEAVSIANSKRPGLILADIQLADGSSGLDAVNEILPGLSVPVVFITAYPERLLTGERPEPAFLITKPFRQDMVKAVVSQALFFRDAARDTRQASIA